jgi:Flp pilus assembly protein TadD
MERKTEAPSLELTKTVEAVPAAAPAPAPAPEPAPAPVVDANPQTDGDPPVASMRLRQDGSIYELADLATLQRWIVERRVNPHDQVSSDGRDWESVRARPDLKVFFQLVSQLEQAELSARADADEEDLPREDTEESGWRGEGSPSSSRVSFDAQTAGDAFAEIRNEGSPAEVSDPSFASGEWDPMDPPSPRLRTDHGFNPSAIGRSPGADHVSEEADTRGFDVPGVGEDGDLGPEPKTIALGDPLGSLDDTEERDPFFAGPTDIDGLTEESPFGPGDSDLSMDTVEHDPDPFFRAPIEEPEYPENDDGPDLPPVEQYTGHGPDDFISSEDPFDIPGGNETLFSVTDDDYLDDDDLWEREQAQSAKTRKIGLIVIAAIAGAFLVFQLMGDEEEGTDGKAETSEASTSTSEPAGTAAQGENKDATDEVEADEVEADEAESEERASAEQAQDAAVDNSEKDPRGQETRVNTPTNQGNKPAETPPANTASTGGSVKMLVDEGWRYVEKDDANTAAARFEKALSKNNRSADAHYGLAYVKDMLGKTDQAFDHYCLALKYSPNNSDTHRDVEGRLRVMGQSCN